MQIAFETLLVLVCFLWLGILSFFFIKLFLYYSRIIKNGKKESLIEILDKITIEEKKINNKIGELEVKYDKLKNDGQIHIQKIGLLRFNPFKDTGGDQSFILALLDGQESGVVISSLHTRTGTRWYAKRVVDGKGVEYELSDDERKALKETKVVIKDKIN